MSSQPSIDNVHRLFNRLITDKELYFHNDYLNSEGRKLFEKITTELLNKYPFLKRNIYVARRKPTFENIVKLYNILSELNSLD